MKRYKYDLHVHTSETSNCGRIPGRRVAELYRDAGYDGIVVTDHFYAGFFADLGKLSWEEKVDRFLAGYRAAAGRGREIGLTVLLGLEMRFTGSANDYLVYGSDEGFLKENPTLLDLGLDGFSRLSREKGFLLYQAHPFRPEIRVADARLLDGVEVYNGNPRHDSRNFLARDFAAAHGLRMLSGSDCHQIEDLGRGGIVVREKVGTMADLVRLLREERVEELIGG